MLETIEEYHQEIKSLSIQTPEELEKFRIDWLSKKGKLTSLFEAFKKIEPGIRKEIGQKLNSLKKDAETLYQSLKEVFDTKENIANEPKLDLSLPGEVFKLGSRHPISILRKEVIDIFSRIGFNVAQGPEIEDDWHNFTALNFPPEHPARDMQDTFFIEKSDSERGKDIALRTHTSSVQIRYMESNKPPLRAIMPGRVYRNEAISARSNCFFHQIEGLYVDKNVSFADLKQTLFYFVQELFGIGTEIRFRPSYFPFTEPSAEMDITCQNCRGRGCNICKHSGWVEILGCGMIDPQVLANCQIDPEIYSGFAFGLGIDRMALNRFKVSDIRTFFENDVRFLSQFSSLLV